MSRFIARQRAIWAGLCLQPGFIVSVVATMSLALGALLCVATLAFLLLFKPLPYPEQSSLYKIEQTFVDNNGELKATAFTYPTLALLYKEQQAFSTAAMLYYGKDILTSHPAQPTLALNYVTPEWFEITDANLTLGRAFQASEAKDSNNPVAVLSYDTWQNVFAGDPDIIGEKLDFNGVSFAVVGVTAEDYFAPQLSKDEPEAAVYLPWDFNQGAGYQGCWGCFNPSMALVGKLRPTFTASQAQQASTMVINQPWQSNTTKYAVFNGWSSQVQLTSFNAAIMGESYYAVYLLIAAVLGVVVIAAANITNLFISRTAKQQQSLAIRAALGANKMDLFKHLFAESAQLMLLSVIIGLAISQAGFVFLQQHMAEVLPRIDELSIDLATFVVAFVCWLLFAGLFAQLSVSMINYAALNTMLQSSGKGTGVQVSKLLRNILIGIQVAIAATLIFVNMTLFQAAIDEMEKPLGFETDNVHYLGLSYLDSVEMSPASLAVEVNQIKASISQLPQVEQVSLSSSPLGFYELWGLTEISSNQQFQVNIKTVAADYFELIEQPFLAGDAFSPADHQDQTNVMIINDVFAQALGGNGSSLGLRIKSAGESEFRVIGVVKSIKIPGQNEQVPRAYVLSTLDSLDLLIKYKPRFSVDRETLVETIQRANRIFAIYQYQSLQENRAQRLLAQTTTALTTSSLVVLSFVLAAIGIYAIQNYSSQMRRVEFGIRVAIGATGWDLIKLNIHDSLKAFLFGGALSVGFLLCLYLSYPQAIADYVNIGLIAQLAITLLLILFVLLLSSYLPLRNMLKNPAVELLQGKQ